MQVKDSHKDRRGHIILAVSCFLLQVMLSPHIQMGNGHINFAIVYAGVHALMVGGRTSVIVGFVTGLLFDLLSTGPVGLMAGTLTVFAFALGKEERNRFADGFVSSLSSFGVGSLFVFLVYQMAMMLTGDATSMVDLIIQRLLPSFAMTFMAFLPFAYLQVKAASGSRGRHAMGKSAGLRENHYDVRGL